MVCGRISPVFRLRAIVHVAGGDVNAYSFEVLTSTAVLTQRPRRDIIDRRRLAHEIVKGVVHEERGDGQGRHLLKKSYSLHAVRTMRTARSSDDGFSRLVVDTRDRPC